MTQVPNLDLTKAERIQLLAFAVRTGLIWSLVASAFWILFWFFDQNDVSIFEVLFTTAVVFVAAFELKRRSLLKRVELLRKQTMQRHGLENFQPTIPSQPNGKN